MSEYDLQFQADLEKAQALSLESLALEQFRRQKLANTGSENNGRDSAASSRRREDSEPPPALPPPPRKPPRRPSNADNTTRSSGASPTLNESSDLICFSSPTSKTAPKDPHASLKEYINKLGQQPEEPTTPVESPVIMNNHPFNQRPGFPPTPNYSPQYPYYNQQQFPVPPYPASPYVPAMPVPYYMPPAPTDPNNPYQMYPALPTVPYNQTRLASPSPYVQYPTQVVTPTYNYNTTNMIARPPRPNLYPNLNNISQMHTYPPPSGSAQSPAGNVNAQSPIVNVNNNTTVKSEPSRNSVESNASGKSSESNESADTIGSLPKSLNLIDFGRRPSGEGGRGAGGAGSVRVSVLEAFDPLLTDQSTEYAVASECSSSVYEEYDPLDFLYGETEMRDTPVYATISKRESAMLPSPPPKAIPSVPAMPKRTTTNKLYDCIVKTRSRNYDSEHKAFLKMVLDVRKRFVYTDETTNPGHVIAARSGGKYPPNTSIKILVHHQHNDEPITFTSDVESTVEHVILTVVCSLEEDIREDMSYYMLRVWGAKEYLTPGSNLSEYDYIRECVRLEKDVKLCLHEGRDTTLARTERDDARDGHLTLDDLIPSQGTPSLSFDNLSILLETLEGELSRAVGVTGAEGSCSPKAVFQAVKAICALAGGVETLHVTHTLNSFAQACTSQGNSNVVTPEIHADNGPYCNVSIRSATAREAVAMQCGRVRDAVRSLVALYSRTRLLDFALAETHYLTPSNVDSKCSVSIRSATAREAVAMQCGRVRDAVRSLVALYSRTRLLDFALAETHYLTPSNVDSKCSVSIRSATAREAVAMQCGRVRDAVRSLVALYSRTRLLDFALAETHYLTPSNVDSKFVFKLPTVQCKYKVTFN
ncbi:PI3-kinase family, ras-binding domain-containing protein [Phthorimaea operculella]|nr:PI3-kinase family, ras-binding domain-containing protein [Phthorimaea operculella]